MIQQSHFFNIYLPKWNENKITQILHMYIYCPFVHDYQNLQHPRCSSVGEWMNKLRYIQTVDYYLALKENVLLSNTKT